LHERDRSRGLGRAPLPDAVARKYPAAEREWGWQWVFPASSHYVDRRTGMRHRYHVHESGVQRAVKEAVRRAGLARGCGVRWTTDWRAVLDWSGY
jgi:hypothetical protein